MILLHLNNLKNKEVLNKIYSDVINYKMQNIIEIIYKVDVKEKNYLTEGIIASYYLVDISDFKDMDSFDIEEVFFDFIEKDFELLLDFKHSTEEFNKEILEIIKDLEVDYSIYNKELFLNPNIYMGKNKMTTQVIYEIFEEQPPTPIHSLENFLYVRSINDKGVVKGVDGNYIGNVLKNPLHEFIFQKDAEYKRRKKILEITKEEQLFGSKIASMIPFIDVSETIKEDIEEFKIKVFEEIKNINPRDYKELDNYVVDLLNNKNYIQLNDIKKIIKEEEDYLYEEESNDFFVINSK